VTRRKRQPPAVRLCMICGRKQATISRGLAAYCETCAEPWVTEEEPKQWVNRRNPEEHRMRYSDGKGDH
jgi:predicted amidophosphoribosyltransferase